MSTHITLHFIAPDASQKTVTGTVGKSLMEAAVSAGIEGIAADCGGMLTCATCHVRVQEPFVARLAPPSDDEVAMLDFTAEPAVANSRLSCQITLSAELEGLTVMLPTAQH